MYLSLNSDVSCVERELSKNGIHTNPSVGRTAKWDLQTGNCKDDLQLSSCPNWQYRANTVPVRLPLSPVSVSASSFPVFHSHPSSVPVRAASGRNSVEQAEQEEGAVTLFSSPVKSQMGAYLHVY